MLAFLVRASVVGLWRCWFVALLVRGLWRCWFAVPLLSCAVRSNVLFGVIFAVHGKLVASGIAVTVSEPLLRKLSWCSLAACFSSKALRRLTKILQTKSLRFESQLSQVTHISYLFV